MNATIKKTQIFNKIKLALKSQQRSDTIIIFFGGIMKR